MVMGAGAMVLLATLSWLDHAVIVVCLAAMIGLGMLFSWRQRNENEYFLAGRRMPWFIVGISIIASLLSSLTHVSEPGEVWKSGITHMAGIARAGMVYSARNASGSFRHLSASFRQHSAMATPFRIALVGLDHPHGAGWRRTLLNLGSEIEITALVPRFENGTASLEERHARVPRFDTVDELIERSAFDGALVCLPNHESPEAVVRLANAGKHVMAEKPVAGDAESMRSAVEAVQRAGIAFQNGYTWRYDVGANRLREMIGDGRFGKLISIETSFITSDVARRGASHYVFDRAISGGGFFNWLACHWLDLLFYVTRQAVVGVTARVGVFGDTPIDVEDGGVAILELANGSLATFTGGYWIPRWMGESRWSLRGSQRWVHWDPARAETGGHFEIHGPQPQWDAMEETFSLPPDLTPGYGGYRAVDLLIDWIAAARQPGKTCRNTPQSTLATLELIDTIYRSSSEGRRIACHIDAT